MPKSRGRKKRRSTTRRPSRPVAGQRQGWGEMEPWVRAIFAADEAEARGDALGTLDIIETFAAGPDGEFFWRPWRAKHLMQITILGPILPGWVISRWICNQALSSLHDGNRWRALRAFDVAVELRGGEENLPGRDAADAYGRVVDRDWVYRQQLLYELGGLDFFVRRVASPSLVARADSIAEWGRAPMGGYQLVGSTADTVTWLDLASGEERLVPNVAAAASSCRASTSSDDLHPSKAESSSRPGRFSSRPSSRVVSVRVRTTGWGCCRRRAPRTNSCRAVTGAIRPC